MLNYFIMTSPVGLSFLVRKETKELYLLMLTAAVVAAGVTLAVLVVVMVTMHIGVEGEVV